MLQGPIGIDQPHVVHGIQKDRALASLFFATGPKAMRSLRLRHGGKGSVVTRVQYVEWINEEVDSILQGPRLRVR
jgi:hypothetical protein